MCHFKQSPLAIAIAACLMAGASQVYAETNVTPTADSVVSPVATNQSCHAIYSLEDKTLYVPCVDAESGVSYAVILQQENNSDPVRFSIRQAVETERNDFNGASVCRSVYTVETGELYIPCAEMMDAEGNKEVYKLTLEVAAGDLSQPLSVVSVETNTEIGSPPNRMPRTLRAWGVPYLWQKAYANIGASACGPTSVAMLLKYYYPNSSVDMPEIYQAGAQAYIYNSGPASGYKNVGFNTLDGDTGLSIISTAYKGYYQGTYSGMVLTDMQKYLQNVWGVQTAVLDQNGVYNAIQSGPVLGHVWGNGDKRYGHYLVIRGIDDKNTATRTDDTIYVNDPYTWSGVSGNNRAVSYNTFFGSWFRDALRLTPQETATQRQYTTVVDTGQNNFGGSAKFGTGFSHYFTLDYPSGTKSNGTPIWKYYYGSGGDWYYPTEAGHAARWTPRLMRTGSYQVSVKYKADSTSGNVTYTVYSSTGTALKSVTVNQYSSTPTWTYAIIADPISLSNGAYVRASNIAANTNIDAAKFKFLY